MKGCMLVNKDYQVWLNHPKLDKDLKTILMNMSDEAIQDAFYKPLAFGTGGMRGVMGPGTNRMNVHTLQKAAYGFGKYLSEQSDAPDKTVAIAYDNRENSALFAKTCVEVLASFGIKSYLFEALRPTPLLSFAVRETASCGGIVITASHNPPKYNGFKIYDADGCQLVPKYADRVVEHVNAIEDIFSIPKLDYEKAEKQGLVELLSRAMDNSYLDAIKTVQFQPEAKKQVKIVFTPLHGASREIGLRSLTELGYEVIAVEEQMIADPTFKTVESPNPEDVKAFEYAVKYGKQEKADLLIATDPDGDRLGIAVLHNGKYEYLNGNQTGALFIEYILESLKASGKMPEHGVIYNTVVTSDFGAAIAKTYGVRVQSTLTGFKFIGEQMKLLEDTKEQFIMGYEESYGYVIKDFVRDKDAIQAMVLAAEIANQLKARNATLIDYLHELYEKYGTYREKLVNINLEGETGEKAIERIMEYFRTTWFDTFEGAKVVIKEDYQRSIRYEDGHEHIMDYPKSNVIKYILEDDAWFVLRPSGTEPKLKIYIAKKAPGIEAAEQHINRLKTRLMETIETLKTDENEDVNT